LLGFIIHVIILTHFIWSLFRPHIEKPQKDGTINPPSDIRVFWEYFHRYIGRGLVLSSFIQIPLGLCKYVDAEITQLDVCFANDVIRPYLILHFVYVGIYITFIVVREIIRRVRKPYQELK